MAFFIEENESSDPAGISLFGTVGVIFSADGITDLTEQFLFGHQTPLDHENMIVMLYFDYIPGTIKKSTPLHDNTIMDYVPSAT